MPHFFFDTYDGIRHVKDDVGQDLDTIEAAKAEALKALPDMAREEISQDSHRTTVVSVRDESGNVVLRAALSLIVEEGTLDD